MLVEKQSKHNTDLQSVREEKKRRDCVRSLIQAGNHWRRKANFTRRNSVEGGTLSATRFWNDPERPTTPHKEANPSSTRNEATTRTSLLKSSGGEECRNESGRVAHLRRANQDAARETHPSHDQPPCVTSAGGRSTPIGRVRDKADRSPGPRGGRQWAECPPHSFKARTAAGIDEGWRHATRTAAKGTCPPSHASRGTSVPTTLVEDGR